MRSVKRHIVWMLVALVSLSGCEPLQDLGDALGDLLRRIAP